jgi:hypothetical protein
MGESFYAEGNDAASLATVGGESAFVGKAEAHPAMGLIGKMLSEGYRWNEQVIVSVLDGRRVRYLLQLLAADCGALPPVGLALRLRPAC